VPRVRPRSAGLGAQRVPSLAFRVHVVPSPARPRREDHETYMRRAAYWYDNPAGTAPAPAPKGTDMTPEQAQELTETRHQLAGPSRPGEFPGWSQLGGRTVVDALAAIGEELGIEGFEGRP